MVRLAGEYQCVILRRLKQVFRVVLILILNSDNTNLDIL